jgi:hypothetical protein
MSAEPGDMVLHSLKRDPAKATACALIESSASGHGPCRSEHLMSRTSANVKPCVAKMGMQDNPDLCAAEQGRYASVDRADRLIARRREGPAATVRDGSRSAASAGRSRHGEHRGARVSVAETLIGGAC